MILGVTGGIGAGKSLVCDIFKYLGISVYNSDLRAKELMAQDTGLIGAIKNLIGLKAYSPGNILDRHYIAEKVFKDKALLAQLNALVHPVVGNDFKSWYDRQNAPYCIQETAILFESGAYRKADYILTVIAPDDLRIKRVMDRDKVSEDKVRLRMSQQISQQEKIERSDFIIKNDGTALIVPQVLSVYQVLTTKEAI